MAPMSCNRTLRAVLAAAAVSLVAACGGGGGGADQAPAPSPPVASGAAISRLVVVGDSLADVGTFGFKATVQRAADPAGYPVYPELVARNVGLAGPCNHFSNPEQDLTFDTRAGCTNFAVGGASIVNPVTRGGDRLPLAIGYQLETALAATGGAWRPGDLIVIDAGANDAAGLADTYLDTLQGSTAGQAVFLALLAQQLSGSTIDQALAQPDGGSVAANLYMQQLARTYWDMLRVNALDRGATRLAIVNVPDITLTPRFRKGLTSGVATAQGAAAAADFEAAVRRWIVTFNTELARLAAGDARVAVVDYFADFSAQNATPAAFGLTDASEAACPQNLDFPQCTDAALDAAPPSAGLAPGWWKTWLYSDRFHPSPRGHELLAGVVVRGLERAGWR